jgi:hypothetical protein
MLLRSKIVLCLAFAVLFTAAVLQNPRPANAQLQWVLTPAGYVLMETAVNHPQAVVDAGIAAYDAASTYGRGQYVGGGRYTTPQYAIDPNYRPPQNYYFQTPRRSYWVNQPAYYSPQSYYRSQQPVYYWRRSR